MTLSLRLKGIATLAIVFLAFGFANAQTSCPGFKTFTQGGWGAAPTGNNPGTFLNNNFAANFPAPTYLTIGCTNKLQLTSASAVRAFLPNGTTPYVLPAGTLVNRTKNNYSNVFAGQLVALALNLRFDTNIPSFGSSTTNLKDLIIASGPFMGKTVQFLFDEANKKIGGCTAFNATLSQYTTAIDNVNRNYDNGTNTQSFLVCPLTATCSATPALCFGGNGSMTVTTNGGLAPFTYSWSGGVAGNVATATGLPAGTYTVTVTDACMQSATTTCTVTQPTQVIAVAVVNGSILCNGGTTTVTVSATGGTGSYTGTGTFTVGAGSYTYDVADANGCPASVSVSITEPAPLEVSINVTERIRCNNYCNGVILSSVSGGTTAYSYAWSNGSTDSYVAGVCSGNYSLTVTDANGCVATSNEVELDNPEVLALSAYLVVEDDNCGDDICNGSASVEVTGGEPEYTYVWSIGSSDSNEITGLCEGEAFSVTVTDARGCVVSANDEIMTCTEQDCGPHKTFTQGGWGAEPNGNNPGVYLHANFDAAYPSGLTIGCGDNTLSFYSAQEITDFLPEGGTADALPNLSVLAGQLVAASLNVGFDAYDSDFAGSDVALGDMFTDAAGFEGMTVADIVAAANEVIGGCSDAFDYTALNAVLTTINENFDNGTIDNGHLTCSNQSSVERSMEVVKASASSFMLNVYPNPAVDVANVQISATRAEIFDIALYSMTGDLVVSYQRSIPAGTTTLDLQVSELPSMAYVLRVSSANQNKTQIVEVR